jgi:heat shock protein beta
MLQNTSFLKQIRNSLLKHVIQAFTKIAEGDPVKFEKVHGVYGNVFKVGAIEDTKNSEKLLSLARFTTNQRNFTSLDDYLENKKENQKQVRLLHAIPVATSDPCFRFSLLPTRARPRRT